MRFSTLTIPLLLATVTARSLDYLPDLSQRDYDPSTLCRADLPPQLLNLTLMVPVSAKNPATAYGSTENPKATADDFCTIFTFEIPPDPIYKYCQFEFFFPTSAQLAASSSAEPSNLSYSGGGHFVFAFFKFSTGATTETTWDTQPHRANRQDVERTMTPGHVYAVSYEGCGYRPERTSMMLCSKDTSFEYFQRYNPCPIGLYGTIV